MPESCHPERAGSGREKSALPFYSVPLNTVIMYFNSLHLYGYI